MTFEDFRKLAKDPSLSKYGKIDFPDSYRKGFERLIFYDILSKLTNLLKENQVVMDIGCGCSELPELIMRQCETNHHRLVLVDSQEMLDLLPDKHFTVKIPGEYPCVQATGEVQVDAVLAYSVIQYVKHPMWFINRVLNNLAPGGQFLIGDIPNTSMRERFRKTRAGRDFPPSTGQIDDEMVLAILGYCRSAGYNAFVMPQSPELPMANRREDILMCKP